ncbi:MAG TPA: hypothetical protein VGG10_08125 [Rhizomicrobium sp.]|jgi:hypothetical protein
MGTTHWLDAANGDFAKRDKWDDGRPDANTDAVIDAVGANYVVKVISADAANSLTVDSATALVQERGHGSLDLGALDIKAGTVALTTANTIGSIAMSGGELKFTSAAALGEGTISLTGDATFSAIASAEIDNAITLGTKVTFTVGHGQTLALDGPLTFASGSINRLNFISNGHGSIYGGTGVIDVNDTGSINPASAGSYLTIKGVIVGSTVADSSFFNSFVSGAKSVTVDTDSGLDLAGQNNVSLSNLTGYGSVYDYGGALENLFISNAQFSGTLFGNFDLTLDGGKLSGAVELAAGDTIHVIDTGEIALTSLGKNTVIDLDAANGGGVLSLEGRTPSGALGVDLGTSQNNELDIDNSFNGTILDFGGHNGGTDAIVIADEAAASDWTLKYQPNDARTAGQLIVRSGAGAVVATLNLEGNYALSDFSLNQTAPYLEIDCSVDVSGPSIWANAVTGDFAKAHKWNGGRPNIETDAIIDATGADYVVKVISADAASTLTISSANALLQERGHGSLDVGTLNIASGAVALTTANTIGSIAMTGGELKFASAAALGSGAISVGNMATLSAIDSAEIANAIAISGTATVTVGHGETLTLDGALTFDTRARATLIFGSNGHGSGDRGAIDLGAGSMGPLVKPLNIDISGVTLESSTPDDVFFKAFLADGVTITNGGVLDLTNQDNLVAFADVVKSEVINRGPLEQLTLGANLYGGTVAGDFDIKAESLYSYNSTFALQSGAIIHVLGDAQLNQTHFVGDAPAIDLEPGYYYSPTDFNLENTTSDGAGPAVDMGVGGNVRLEIDSTFTGTISNFGDHGDGTNGIELEVSYSEGTPTLTYQPNADGTGGELIVQYGPTSSIALNLRGTYTQSDFTWNYDEIECSGGQLGTTNWSNAVSGDFAEGGNWAHGAPDAYADAAIAATGTAYTVNVTDADVAQTLTIESADATLLETGSGSLTLGTLDITAGTAVLTSATNSFDAIVIVGGTLEFSSVAALGGATVNFDGNGALSATADAEITSNITIAHGGTLGASNGVTLEMDDALGFGQGQIDFIGNDANGTADGSGIVDLDGTISMGTDVNDMLIGGVTLTSSKATDFSFEQFLSEARSVDIADYGILDLSQQKNINLHGLSGTGEIVNTGANENLFIGGGFDAGPDLYQGEIKGNFDITVYTVTFSGKIDLSAGDTMSISTQGDFSGADFIGSTPAFDLINYNASVNLAGTTFEGAAPMVDLGRGGLNNSLYIDHTFAGTIIDFGGAKRWADHIFLADESGLGDPLLNYIPNASGDGGSLVVKYGTGPSFALKFEGHYTQDDFTASGNEIDYVVGASQTVTHSLDSLI